MIPMAGDKLTEAIAKKRLVDYNSAERMKLEASGKKKTITYTDIMGIKVPTTTIPVNPGRNLAIILEIAAMNNHQKKMGYNTAEEFNKRLMDMGIPE